MDLNMAGMPPHREPQTQEEAKIALAMTYVARFCKELREHYPGLPPSAVSAGLINWGVRVGCEECGDPYAVASYLEGVAKIIAPKH